MYRDKRLWPAYNRALKRFEPKFGLFRYEAQNGYHYLAVGKLKKHCQCLQTFNVEYEGIHVLRQLMINFDLDPRMCMFAAADTPYAQRIKEADADLPNIEIHNAQVDLAVDHLLGQQPTFVIVDKGRTLDEKVMCGSNREIFMLWAIWIKMHSSRQSKIFARV